MTTGHLPRNTLMALSSKDNHDGATETDAQTQTLVEAAVQVIRTIFGSDPR